MNKYSDAVIAKMREIGSFNYTSAKVFAEENGLTARSVVAKVNALGLEYVKQDSKNKTASKTKTRAKADIVAVIQKQLGQNLDSLSKMTVADLESLELALA